MSATEYSSVLQEHPSTQGTVAGSMLITAQSSHSTRPLIFNCPMARAFGVTNGASAGGIVGTFNWGGYVAVSSFSSPQPVFNAINGSWIVQQALPSSGPTYSSQWVGIGGFNDQTLIQTGTSSEYNTTLPGQPYYYAWYELIPALPVKLPYPVAPGDSISASVRLINSSNYWNITIRDSTQGWSNSVIVQYSSSQLSAEAIDERPELCSLFCTYANLTRFNSSYYGQDYSGIKNTTYVTADGASYPLGKLPYYPVEMIADNNQTDAYPLPISGGNTSFAMIYGPKISPAPAYIVEGTGNYVNLSISAGLGPYSYQWYLNGNPVGTGSRVLKVGYNASTQASNPDQVYVQLLNKSTDAVVATSSVDYVSIVTPLGTPNLTATSIADSGALIPLNASVMGGVPPYTYNFTVYYADNGISAQHGVFSNYPYNSLNVTTVMYPGKYFANVVVSDSGAPTASRASADTNTITINTAPILKLSALQGNAIDLGGANTLSFTAQISNGTGPYTMEFLTLSSNSFMQVSNAIIYPVPLNGVVGYNATVNAPAVYLTIALAIDNGTSEPEYNHAAAYNLTTVNSSLATPALIASINQTGYVHLNATAYGGTPPYLYHYTVANASTGAIITSSGTAVGSLYIRLAAGSYYANVLVNDSAWNQQSSLSPNVYFTVPAASPSNTLPSNSIPAYFDQGQSVQIKQTLPGDYYNAGHGELYADYGYNYTWMAKTPSGSGYNAATTSICAVPYGSKTGNSSTTSNDVYACSFATNGITTVGNYSMKFLFTSLYPNSDPYLNSCASSSNANYVASRCITSPVNFTLNTRPVATLYASGWDMPDVIAGTNVSLAVGIYGGTGPYYSNITYANNGTVIARIYNMTYNSTVAGIKWSPKAAGTYTIEAVAVDNGTKHPYAFNSVPVQITAITAHNATFNALIGSVLNQGVALGLPGLTKQVTSNTTAAYPESYLIKLLHAQPSPYSAHGSVNTNATPYGGNSGGIIFSSFTNVTADNLLRINSTQLTSLASNFSSYGENEYLWLSGFPVYDQQQVSKGPGFAVLSAGGAYQAQFSTPIPEPYIRPGNTINSPTIRLLGRNYTILNYTEPAAYAASGSFVSGGGLQLGYAMAQPQIVYIGRNISANGFTLSLTNLGQPNSQGVSSAAVSLYYDGILANTSQIYPNSLTKFQTGNHMVYVYLERTFNGTYAYQKWAQIGLYYGTLNITDSQPLNRANANGWTAYLLWTNGTSAGYPNGLQSIIAVNQTPQNLRPGENYSFAGPNMTAYRVKFVGDTLGTNYDPVQFTTQSVSSGGVQAYQNLGTQATGLGYTIDNISNQPAQLLTVTSQIPNAFSYAGQQSSSVQYDLTPYAVSTVANAVTPGGLGATSTPINVIIYSTIGEGNIINPNNPLTVTIKGYRTSTSASATTTPVQVATLGGASGSSNTLSLPNQYYNITNIYLSRALPYITVNVVGGDVASSTANTLAQLTTLSTPAFLYSVPNQNYLDVEVATGANALTYNQQNGQAAYQGGFQVHTVAPGVGTNSNHEYFTYNVIEYDVPGSTTWTDALAFGIYNSTTAGAQNFQFQLNESSTGTKNNVTYTSSQGGSVQVPKGFVTERGSSVASINPGSLTFNLAKAVDTLQFVVTPYTTSLGNATTQKTVGPVGVGQAVPGYANLTVYNVSATCGGVSASSSECNITGLANVIATPSVSQAVVPVALNTATTPLAVLDTNANSAATLIVVGSKYVNSVAGQIFAQNPALNSSFGQGSVIVQAYGTNRILVAGYSANETVQAGNQFINDLLTAASTA